MFISDIIYLIFMMVLLFIIIYKGLSFTARSSQHDNNFDAIRDELYYNRHCLPGTDRQSNTFTQANETGRDNRYNDIFIIEANSHELVRTRAQMEKDDHDLPSYDEVMRIANMSSPTAAAANNTVAPAMPRALSTGASSSGNTTTVPPYSQVESIPRPLTPPPYSLEPIGAMVVVPITTPLNSQQNTQNL